MVVHYTVGASEPAASEVDVIGDQGLEVTEGIVTRIDRGRAQITVRYDNGKTETFRLTEHAASEAPTGVDWAAASGMKIVIYYSDERGQKVAHFFRKIAG